MSLARKRQMLSIEQAEEYTGYSDLIIKRAIKRGELKGERPGGSKFARLYFEQAELDRWLAAIEVDAEAQ
ncbi:helix-turn-helix domain-containing protein [Pseudonocardia cypriaca]|uniref:Excisionase family DNA binding protein n=1 Tax=Pseudonocardia cypriaca TaxID=882449 RepID=A0A543GDG6_9PSEU|nr:helix-turn-helix domain-containing protein [Pseudonocardia cypriaca]TQM44114.1 excisionase family DNA binding protein [Pseudonocardia cypriaca]